MGPSRPNSMRSAASKSGAVTRAQTQTAAQLRAARDQAAHAEQQSRMRAQAQSVPSEDVSSAGSQPPFQVTKSKPQKTNGSVAVRKASAQERVAQSMANTPFQPDAAVERGLQRVGKKFRIETRPDGKIVHVYGNDVPASMRRIVLPARRRASA